MHVRYLCARVGLCMCVCVCDYVYISVCIYDGISVHVCLSMFVYVCECVYICVHVYDCVYVCVWEREVHSCSLDQEGIGYNTSWLSGYSILFGVLPWQLSLPTFDTQCISSCSHNI